MSRKAWEMMEGEPPKAYALFLLYRSMGVGRTVAEVATKIQRPKRKIQLIANRYNWVFRADQWDAWALRYKSKAQEQRLMREAQVEARTVTDVLKAARILARRTLKKLKRDKNFILTPMGAAQLADLAVKLARLERGDVTSRSESVTSKVREDLKDKLEQMARDLKPSDAASVKKGQP